VCLAVWTGIRVSALLGVILLLVALYNAFKQSLPAAIKSHADLAVNLMAILTVGIILTSHWMPLGPGKGTARNIILVAALIGGLLTFFRVFQIYYPKILGWCLQNKRVFLAAPVTVILLAIIMWLGVEKVFAFTPQFARNNRLWTAATKTFPGFGKEFMPPLDEGSFLYMPSTMPHASIGETLDVLQLQDAAFQSIPEIDSVVGKLGRAETPLDPAPVSMIETVINYKPEYILDKDGHRLRFKYDRKTKIFARDENGDLIRDRKGKPFRQWRDHIITPDDIWNEIVKAGEIPGTTGAPKLQPIATRLIMLQSGMRAPMGIKVKGPSLEAIDKVGLDLERLLKEVPTVKSQAVIADRIVGKPYLEIDIDRNAIARYGIHIRQVQDVIEVAIGGKTITTTIEGRERFGVRVRYLREMRDSIENLGKILVPGANGVQIPLIQLAEIKYVKGPQSIKSEDTFLIGYVLFDMKSGNAEVDVVEDCQEYFSEKEQIFASAFEEASKSAAAQGRSLTQQEIDDLPGLNLPEGVSYTFAGNYENQIRAQKTLMLAIPMALFLIFLILYFQFKSVLTTFLVFSGIGVAWAGGFIMIWLYSQNWFLDFSVFGENFRDLFQVHPINISVAIWVGFLALFGIASDDGVVMCTYLQQSFAGHNLESVDVIRNDVIRAGTRRIRPCLMTTATTILALIPVLTSTGRGSDIMVPMAIPSFGGMTIEILTMLVVPVLYCAIKEAQLKKTKSPEPKAPPQS
jgi:Cu(I)/Ag(I) efflux system membrane protein CusA/SilA